MSKSYNPKNENYLSPNNNLIESKMSYNKLNNSINIISKKEKRVSINNSVKKFHKKEKSVNMQKHYLTRIKNLNLVRNYVNFSLCSLILKYIKQKLKLKLIMEKERLI